MSNDQKPKVGEWWWVKLFGAALLRFEISDITEKTIELSCSQKRYAGGFERYKISDIELVERCEDQEQ